MKKQVSWTIDEEVIKEVEEESDKDMRSTSYTANEILKNHFKQKTKVKKK